MSFSFQFTAKREDVSERLNGEHGPESVKEFVRNSLIHLTSPQVNVYAYGHLCDGPQSYKVSNCSVTVTPVDNDGNPVS